MYDRGEFVGNLVELLWRKTAVLVSLVACLVASSPINGQTCAGRWVQASGVSGGAAVVDAVTSLANGDLVVGGVFDAVESVRATNIAKYSVATSQWSSLGMGVNGRVYAMARLTNDDLIAAGDFTQAGAVAASNIARWNASTASWTAMGSGVNGPVWGLGLMSDGQVAVGGSFSFAGGISVNGVARWNPASGAWSSLGNHGGDGCIALATSASGDVVIADTMNRVYRRASSTGSWSAVGASPTNGGGIVWALVALANGDVLVGYDDPASIAPRDIWLSRWNASTSTWIPLGTSSAFPGGPTYALALLTSGDVAVGGAYVTTGGVASPAVSRWSLTTNAWVGMNGQASGLGVTYGLHGLPGGDAVATGSAVSASQDSEAAIVKWSSATNSWTRLGTATAGTVNALAVLDSGKVAVGGTFAQAGGVEAHNVALWDPSTESWSSLGGGITGGVGLSGGVRALLPLPGGQLVAGGLFSRADGQVATNVARWDPSNGQWMPMGVGLPGGWGVSSLTVSSSGSVLAAGLFAGTAPNFSSFSVAEWNASAGTWTRVNTTFSSFIVNAITSLPNGNIAAAGRGFSPTQRDGSGMWSPIGGTLAYNHTCLLQLSGGDIIAGFNAAIVGGRMSNVARWSSTNNSWTPIGSGILSSTTGSNPVLALAVRSDGDLVAGGIFSTIAGVSTNSIASWNFSSGTWSSLGLGVRGGVHALTSAPGGDLIVGGRFDQSGGMSASSFARWTNRPTCPADFDCSSTLSVQDLFDFLGLWFASDSRADFNLAGGVTVQDLFDYLNGYFAGCL